MTKAWLHGAISHYIPNVSIRFVESKYYENSMWLYVRNIKRIRIPIPNPEQIELFSDVVYLEQLKLALKKFNFY